MSLIKRAPSRVHSSASSHKSEPHGKHKPSLMEDKDKSRKRLHRIIIVSVSLIVVASAISIVVIMLTSKGEKTTDITVDQPTKKSVSTKYYSPLTGNQVSDESITKRPVLAVMIENSPEARPQSGLKDAGVVFEAVAEGGITRFIALYQESEPTLIGPVRSVRPYYLEWAKAFSPAVAHVGGSSEALNMIRSSNYGVDLDQSANGGSYWRAKDRRAPHNVYTDYAHLSSLAKAKNKTTSNFTGFARQSGTVDESSLESATSVKLAVSTGKFAVSYQYDSGSNTYKRFQGGVAHQDREKSQVAPDVVIAIRVNQTLQSDRVHNSIGTTGSGDCYVFQNGKVIQGTWQKASSDSQIKFTDKSGLEIKLHKGQTWITAVGQGRDISWQ